MQLVKVTTMISSAESGHFQELRTTTEEDTGLMDGSTFTGTGRHVRNQMIS